MAQDMKDIGRITRLMAEVDLSMQTETFMKESGKMIKHMAEVFTLMLMAQDTRANG